MTSRLVAAQWLRGTNLGAPHFEARVRPITGLTGSAAARDRAARWDGANIHAVDGTYGDSLLGKVSKVFPELRREVL